MKKSFIFALLFLLLFSVKVDAKDIGILIDGKEVTFTESSGRPFADENSRTQVPLRVTMESYGAEVDWDQTTQTAIVTKGATTVKVPMETQYILINDIKKEIDTKSVVVNNRIYLPIRFVLEAFGANVGWNQEDSKVIIRNNIENKIIFEVSNEAKQQDIGTQTVIKIRSSNENVLLNNIVGTQFTNNTQDFSNQYYCGYNYFTWPIENNELGTRKFTITADDEFGNKGTYSIQYEITKVKADKNTISIKVLNSKTKYNLGDTIKFEIKCSNKESTIDYLVAYIQDGTDHGHEVINNMVGMTYLGYSDIKNPYTNSYIYEYETVNTGDCKITLTARDRNTTDKNYDYNEKKYEFSFNVGIENSFNIYCESPYNTFSSYISSRVYNISCTNPNVRLVGYKILIENENGIPVYEDTKIYNSNENYNASRYNLNLFNFPYGKFYVSIAVVDEFGNTSGYNDWFEYISKYSLY